MDLFLENTLPSDLMYTYYQSTLYWALICVISKITCFSARLCVAPTYLMQGSDTQSNDNVHILSMSAVQPAVDGQAEPSVLTGFHQHSETGPERRTPKVSCKGSHYWG